VLLDRSDEFIKMLVPENSTGLERGGNEMIERDQLHPFAAFERRGGGGHARIDQRAEPFSKCNFCHKTAEIMEILAERQTRWRISRNELAGFWKPR
jgi:hypothetical protein